MELDAIWQTFAETGDPVCYMLYKAAQRGSHGLRVTYRVSNDQGPHPAGGPI